jgi:ParB-like chromosome segregation protein Spo0J
MQIRDRIQDFRRVKASQLRPHPQNWRLHPPAQRDALRGLLAEIGYAGALLARQLPDGSLELIDGHLRAETTPDAEVPVLVVDLDDREAAKLLALHDPLAGMAEANGEVLAELLSHVESENEAVAALLDGMLRENAQSQAANGECGPKGELQNPPADVLPEAFQVVVQCRDEQEQQSVFERLTGEGYTCKLLVL